MEKLLCRIISGKRVMNVKIEKLDANKLKVTLTANDMTQLDLNFARAADDAESVKQAFVRLMKIAQKETGFDVADARLMIEAVPDKDDGFILFVTRVDEAAEEFGLTVRTVRKKPVLKPKRSPQPGGLACMFEFNEFEHLIEFAQHVAGRFTDYSNLYEYNGTYYLSVIKNPLTSTFASICVVASEYGTRLFRNTINEAFLAEHGKLIMKNNAVETIHRYFTEPV